MTNPKFLRTIIITSELQSEIRGYSLLGREFFLHEDLPRKDVAITLDGVEAEGEYWVVHRDEFQRVVPEVDERMFKGEFVYIPMFAAQLSFRPGYTKKKV